MKHLVPLMYPKGQLFHGCLPMPTITFTSSNTYSITFTDSLLSGATLARTTMLTYSFTLTYTLTQTMSVFYSTFSNTLSASNIGTSLTHIETVIVIYNYTVVVYSFEQSYYISIFAIYYPSEARENTSTTNAITVCVSVVAVAIITLIIAIFIKIRNRKESSEYHESDVIEGKYLETNETFLDGISNFNIEEDPFTVDFKEEKFADKM